LNKIYEGIITYRDMSGDVFFCVLYSIHTVTFMLK